MSERIADRIRVEGHARVAVPLAIAILLCVGLGLFFVLSPNPPPGVDPEPDETAAVESAADGTEGGDPAVASGAGAPEAADAPPPSPTPLETDSQSSTLIAQGKITGRGGAPIGGALVRWLDVSERRARAHAHRDRLFTAEETVDVPSPLRDAFAASVVVRSSDDGSYSLPLPAGASVEPGSDGSGDAAEPVQLAGVVIVAADGYAPEIRELETVLISADVEAEAQPQVLELDFVLDAAGRIFGSVTDAEGRPAAGAIVQFDAAQDDGPVFTNPVSRRDPAVPVFEDGTYVVTGLKPGKYSVVARTGDTTLVSTPVSRARTVVIEAGVDATGVDFRLEAGGRIRGVVLDSDGAPIGRAECRVAIEDIVEESVSGNVDLAMLAEEKEVRSDAAGKFEIRGVPFGEAFRATADVRGHPRAASEIVTLTEEEPDADVRIVVEPGFAISGRVIDANGALAEGVHVSTGPTREDFLNVDLAATSRSDRTDQNGEFHLEGLPSGAHTLKASRRMTALFLAPSAELVKQDVEISDRDVEGVEIVLGASESTDGMLGGTVVDDLGGPVEGARVRIVPAHDFVGQSAVTAITDSEGQFSARGITGATFRLEAECDGYADGSVSGVSSGRDDVELVLERAARVRGRVVDAAEQPVTVGNVSTAPVDSASAPLESMAALMRGGRDRDGERISPDGTFDLEVFPGRLRVGADVPGYARGLSKVLDLAPGDVIEDIEIVVERGASVSGKVVDVGGAPIAGATVRLVDADDANDFVGNMLPEMFLSPRNRAISGADGEFRIEHIASGAYRIAASHPLYAASEPRPIRLADEDERTADDIVLSEGGKLTVRLTEGEQPKVGLMVQLLGHGFKQGISDADGKAKFVGLAAGEYLVNAVGGSPLRGKMSVKTRPIELTGEGESEIEIVFGVGSSVRGSVRGLPKTIPMRLVTLRRPGGPGPEDVDPTDMKATMAAARFQAGTGFVAPDDTYVIPDVDPGEYILEVPRMPENPLDMKAMAKMDRTPYFRKTVKVGKTDLELDIVIGGR